MDAGATWTHLGLAGDPPHRPHRGPSHQSRHRLRRRARRSVGPQQRARRLQEHRRRRHLDPDALHQRKHRRLRYRHRSAEPQHPLRRGLSAPPHRLRLQRRRSRCAASTAPSTAARTGPSWPAACPPPATSAAAPSTSIARTPTSCTREFEHATLGGVYRSEDKGATWTRMSDTNPRPSYFSQIRVDPNNDQKVWLGGVNIYMSEDGGRTFVQTRFRDVHSDVHAIWIDPANSDHIAHRQRWRRLGHLGQRPQLAPPEQHRASASSTKSPTISRSPITSAAACRTTTPGAVPAPACRPPASATRTGSRCRAATASTPASTPPTPTSSTPNRRTATFRAAICKTSESKSIRPLEDNDTAPRYRFQWNSPLIISPHDPKTIYYGGNHLFKSTDRGDTWVRLGEDLTTEADRDEQPILGKVPKRGETLSAARWRRGVALHHRHRRIAGAAPECCGSAPTTATCRCRATAARPGPTWPATCPACPRAPT